MYETSLQVPAAYANLPFGLVGLIYLNPMTGVLALYRHALLGMDLMPVLPTAAGTVSAIPISPLWLLLSPLSALIILIVGLWILHLGNRHLGDVL